MSGSISIQENRMKNFSYLFLSFILLITMASAALAQGTTSRLTGVVLDQKGVHAGEIRPGERIRGSLSR